MFRGAELACRRLAKNQVIADPAEVARRRPDIIDGSWCGKRFQPQRVVARGGWQEIPAVRDNRVFEIKSSTILQPGPAALTDGLQALVKLVHEWVVAAGDGNDPPPLEPSKPRHWLFRIQLRVKYVLDHRRVQEGRRGAGGVTRRNLTRSCTEDRQAPAPGGAVGRNEQVNRFAFNAEP